MNKVLKEEDFIQESKPRGGWRIWLALALIAICMIITLFTTKWVVSVTDAKVEQNPFLRVTNREFSLFLWQNPEFMRSNRKKKSGYLSGFHLHPKVTPKPQLADAWVSVPPDILFLYHAWNRLLGQERQSREVSVSEFESFLENSTEWEPMFWKDAPENYRQLVKRLPQFEQADIQEKLPDAVLRAYVGWKNYFYDGEAINQELYTLQEVEKFIEGYPQYAIHYWKQLYPEYLRSLSLGGNMIIPNREIPSFLKVALYNHYQGIRNKKSHRQ